MNTQEQAWAGEFGDAYTVRNQVNWLERVPFWTHILALTGAHSVFELGANVGWNLLAIRTIKPTCVITGCDVNSRARLKGQKLDLSIVDGSFPYVADLVFTAGVLIHVAPDQLLATMEQIVYSSMHWVLAIEYSAEEETEVEYRGQMGLLWKRPYGAYYERLGCKLVETGEAQGFDRCTYWLLAKPPSEQIEEATTA